MQRTNLTRAIAATRWLLGCVGCGLVISTSALPAQVVTIPSGITEAEILAAAERQGEAHPRPAPTAGPRRDFADVDKGSAVRRCIEVDRRELFVEVAGEMRLTPAVWYRSGEFVMGGTRVGTSSMVAGRPHKVSWSSLIHASDMPPLELRGRSLTSPSDTASQTFDTRAFTVSAAESSTQAAKENFFFPVGMSAPSAGRWLFIATSGSNWGCFIFPIF